MVLRDRPGRGRVAAAAWERGVAVATLERYFAGPVTVNGLVLGYGGAAAASHPWLRAARSWPPTRMAVRLVSLGRGAVPARRAGCPHGPQRSWLAGTAVSGIMQAPGRRYGQEQGLMADGGVPGVEDVARLGELAGGQRPPRPVTGRPVVQLIAGGRSNLTYRLDRPGPAAPR